VNPGYIELHTRRAGRLHGTPITIPRDVLWPLLRWLVPAAKLMPASSDPITVLREWAAEDELMSRERRKRRRSPRRRRKSERRT
jgi:hypothetical protein